MKNLIVRKNQLIVKETLKIKQVEEKLQLENSPFESCKNSGGVSQRATLKPINNLRDKLLSSQETSYSRRWDRDHTAEQIIGNPSAGVRTRSATQNECLYGCFLSQNEPKKIDETLLDSDCIVAMQEELVQFERKKVWELVPIQRIELLLELNGFLDTRWMRMVL